MRRLLFAVAAAAVILCDQASKYWVSHNLPRWTEIPVLPPVLYLFHTTNDGVAWSLFRRHTDFFSIVAMAFCVGILILGRAAIRRSSLMAVVMGLLLGGAIGNLIDRVRLHYVVDFIDVHIGRWYQWPTFNVADSAITVGMVILAGYFWLSDSRTTRDEPMGPTQQGAPPA